MNPIAESVNYGVEKVVLKKGKNVIMTHLGRVGSTVLTNMLSQHPNIVWLNEYFTIKEQQDSEHYNYTAQEMFSMLESEHSKIKRSGDFLFWGYEIKPINFFHNPGCNLTDYIKLTTDENIFTHIFLRRRNVFKRICSSHKAACFKVWHVKQADGPSKKGFAINLSNPIDYDTGQRGNTLPELIGNAIEFEEGLVATYKKLGIKFLEIFYEDDIENNPACAYEKVIRYLGLDPIPAEVSFKKTSRGLSEDLINYSDIEKQLGNSEYRWMLS